jgi:hypothetical protein
MTKIVRVLTVELAMGGGIVASAFLVPRSFPLNRFVEIALAVLLVGNFSLFRAAKRTQSRSRYQIGPRAYFGIALVIVYRALVALWR